MDIQVLSVSSKGQIALPVNMRRSLAIDSGSKLAAYASGDTIILKVINLPSIDNFKASLDETGQLAENVGYKEEDIEEIIKAYRKREKQ